MPEEVTRIAVSGGADYNVVVGADAAALAAASLPPAAIRVAVISQPTVRSIAADVQHAVTATGRRVVPLEVPDGEAAKTVATAEACWAALGGAGFTRSDAVIGIGGGAATDIAGFVAATWLRGIAVVQVPTTLLGMVDAAIGGKTAINTQHGKNLVGVFHAPRAVVIDPSYLATLDRVDLRSGLAEVAKAGFIRDPVIIDLIEAEPLAVLDPSSRTILHLITRAARVKADVVSGDFREVGGPDQGIGREMLNYGHTLGHAIELVEGYQVRHGAAVSIGMIFAAELAHLLGLLERSAVDRHRTVMEGLGLPTAYRQDRWTALRNAMGVDKKTRGRTLRLVVLRGLGNPVIVADIEPEVLEEAYRRVAPQA